MPESKEVTVRFSVRSLIVAVTLVAIVVAVGILRGPSVEASVEGGTVWIDLKSSWPHRLIYATDAAQKEPIFQALYLEEGTWRRHYASTSSSTWLTSKLLAGSYKTDFRVRSKTEAVRVGVIVKSTQHGGKVLWSSPVYLEQEKGKDDLTERTD